METRSFDYTFESLPLRIKIRHTRSGTPYFWHAVRDSPASSGGCLRIKVFTGVSTGS